MTNPGWLAVSHQILRAVASGTFTPGDPAIVTYDTFDGGVTGGAAALLYVEGTLPVLPGKDACSPPRPTELCLIGVQLGANIAQLEFQRTGKQELDRIDFVNGNGLPIDTLIPQPEQYVNLRFTGGMVLADDVVARFVWAVRYAL